MKTPCVNTGGNTPSRSAQPVHRLQGIRFPGRDYRIPAFYMITMTVLGRKPLFAICENDKSSLNDNGWLVYDLCAQGKLLILSCRPPSPTAVSLTRAMCLDMNRWCTEIAVPADLSRPGECKAIHAHPSEK